MLFQSADLDVGEGGEEGEGSGRGREAFLKGRMKSQKRMNFRKNSKRPLTPPSFSESHIAVFPEFMTEEPFIMAKICNINFWIGNDPPWNFSENSSVLVGPSVP